MFLTHSLFESLSRRIDVRVRELGLPSLVAGVWEKGEVIWSHGSGFSDIEKGRTTDTTTPYSMASITKPAMGTVLAILSERGLLDVNRPANWYLGSPLLTAYEGSAEAATVGRLANHTAGLPVHYQFFSVADKVQPPPYEETLRRYGNIVNPPGERQVYSNLGYGTLGWIAELVAERPLKEFMESEIFGPLGMATSFFAPTSEEQASCAVRYEEGRVPLEHYVTDHPAASELYASLDDLLRFGAWHLSEDSDSVLSPAGKRKMQNPLDSSAAAQSYGLGWRLGSTGHGQKVIAHSGGMAGVTTRLTLCPKRQLVIAVISNVTTNLVDEVVRGIHDILSFHPIGIDGGQQAPVYPPECLFGTWKGQIHTYEGEIDLQLTFSEESEDVLIYGEPANSAFSYGPDSVYGTVEAEINTSDAMRTEHCAVMNLQMRGNGLSGVATADSLGQVTLANALSYPTRLERVSG
jgi:CubicO group peptidase (beta-lactamase class C family)